MAFYCKMLGGQIWSNERKNLTTEARFSLDLDFWLKPKEIMLCEMVSMSLKDGLDCSG